MVEHLGPEFFSPADFAQLVKTICQFVNNTNSGIRQAAAYGVGAVAQHSGTHFASLSVDCLTALKQGAEVAPTEKVKSKKSQMERYYHAQDNCVASLGKILKHQSANLNEAELPEIIKYWLFKLPITHDIEEAQEQYDFLATFVLNSLEKLAGADPAGAAAQLAKIIGEAFDEKYFDEKEEKQA